MKNKYTKWLAEQTPLLVKEGLLTEGQGRGINDYFARKRGRQEHRPDDLCNNRRAAYRFRHYPADRAQLGVHEQASKVIHGVPAAGDIAGDRLLRLDAEE